MVSSSALVACIWSCLVLRQLQPAKGQVRIMAPDSLVGELSASGGRIDGSTATFGAPFYGERILGQLLWGESAGKHHCTADDYSVPTPQEFMPPGKTYKEVRLINIVLVERGTCSFVTKVKVARQKKAHAVIIVDKENSNLTAHDIRRVIVADDGYGANVDIPSILVSREEGQKLIDAARVSQVIVELAWDVPSNHVVIVDLWMSSASSESLSFLKEFAPKRVALNQYLKFVPHYHIFSMGPTSKDFNDLCTGVDGKFCAEDPDGSGAVTGKMVLNEDVRQLCIHEQTKVSMRTRSTLGPTAPEYAAGYWEYVKIMLDECPLDGPSPDHKFGDACSERLMRKVGINVENVHSCMLDTKEDKLREERENVAWSTRALRINGWRFSGAMTADLVTRAVCAGFVEKPEPCRSLVEPVNPFSIEHESVSDGVTMGNLISAVFAVAVISLGALLLYKRSLTKHIHSALREEVMLEVQSQMETYKQLPA